MAFERSIESWRALPQLTVKETAAVLGVGVDSVRALFKQEALDARKVCGKTFVIVASIRRLVDEEVLSAQATGPRELDNSERRIVRQLRGDVA